MIVTKWIEVSQEIEVDIGPGDIRKALDESCNKVIDPRGEESPSRSDILIAIGSVAAFLNALTEDHIAMLLPSHRLIIRQALLKIIERFAEKEPQ